MAQARAEKERDGLVEATLVPASRAACDSRLNYTLLVRLSPTLIHTHCYTTQAMREIP